MAIGPNENKIMMGVENIHWFPLTETEVDGEITTSYGESNSWPGTVQLGADPAGDSDAFYADNGIYFMSGDNVGYTLSLENCKIPEDLEKYALGLAVDNNGILVETSQGQKKAFALTADLTGDKKARRVAFLKCFLQRPSESATTRSNQNTPQTTTYSIVAVPRADFTKVVRDGEVTEEHLVKLATTAAANAEAYANWHKSVQVPAFTIPSAT